jgi:hypothetical protein
MGNESSMKRVGMEYNYIEIAIKMVEQSNSI